MDGYAKRVKMSICSKVHKDIAGIHIPVTSRLIEVWLQVILNANWTWEFDACDLDIIGLNLSSFSQDTKAYHNNTQTCYAASYTVL